MLRIAAQQLIATMLLYAAIVAPVVAAPMAGNSINNQATVAYVDQGTGFAAVRSSGLITTVVQSADVTELTPNRTLARPQGTVVTFAHTLINAGNGAVTYTLSTAVMGGSSMELTDLRIYRDANGNGTLDAGELEINSIALAANQSIDLIVSAKIPAAASVGQQGQLQLIAQSNLQADAVIAIDTVVVNDGASVTLSLSTPTTERMRNQKIPLLLLIKNIGTDAVGIPVSVDDVTVNRVLIEITIPVDTTFVSAVAPAGAQVLFHRVNTPRMALVSVAPEPKDIDGVFYAFTDFNAGRSADVTMTVNVEGNISAQIQSMAQIWFDDEHAAQIEGTPSDIDSAQSNTLRIAITPAPAAIHYYTNDQFTTEAIATGLGTPLHIQVDAIACNQNAAAIDTMAVNIRSSWSGESEIYTATETGIDTSVFRINSIATANANNGSTQVSNGIIETVHNDTLTAVISSCGTNGIWSAILIDPEGVVFDSKSNEPVSGATVQLIDVTGAGNGGNAGGAARVFLDDGVTPAQSVVLTGADGAFRFPLVPASTYRLNVTTPPGHAFASKVPVTALPAGRIIDASASYGSDFVVSDAMGVLHIDLPVDPAAVDGLLVEKTTSRTTAEIGDFVDYSVQVKNNSGTAFNRITVRDTLPHGFAYQPDTLRRDGVAVADPLGGRGPVLSFPIDSLADGATVKLTYRVRIGVGAQLGDGINRAQATSTAPLATSNVAEARVKVEGGVFSDRGFVLGKIFADCNADKIQDAGEPGVPGVRVWLEDGTYAITDGLGKYSFYGLSPRTHVAKIDPSTVPAGAIFEVLDQRNAGVGDSRFIDLKNGELARADFALQQCDKALLDTIAQRRVQAEQHAGELEAGVNVALTLDNNAVIDPRSKAASGLIEENNTNPKALATAIATVEAAILAQRPLAEVADSLDNSTDFVGLSDGAAVAGTQIRLLVKGLLGTSLTVLVNGDAIPDSRLGTRVTRAEKQLEIFEFIGVELKPGNNTLTLEQRDPFGNLRATKTISVRAPGELHHIRIERVAADSSNASSDTSIKVAVFLEDKDGLPVSSRTALTLETSNGAWAAEDRDPTEPGTQVFVESGRSEFVLRAPEQPGSADVKVSSGKLSAETRVDFLPTLRDMIAAGVIEGTLKLDKLGSGALQPARQQDGFEQELKQFSRDNGKAAARAAVFLKGKIKGDYLLTLGYDSDKETRERLFRDIQPDQFYPVYGDSSIKGYDAQSTQKMYVRVDKNKSWLLYGDFNTPTATSTRSLTAYNRSLTGVRQHYEDDKVAVNTFASRDSTRQVVEELRANGTSGPYTLSNNDLIENSEQIEIITRDRNQPALIIKSVPMSRFADYQLEPFTGRILFRAPIASVDADLNPNSVRVSYEVDAGGATFWVGGVDATMKVTKNIAVGAVDIEDRDPIDTGALRGANMTFTFDADNGAKTTAITEVAHSNRFSVGSGDAQRIDIKHDSEKVQARVYAGRADADFYNPSATLSKGHSEAGAKVSRKLDERTRLVADAIHSADDINGGRREGVLAGVERAFDGNVKLEVGVRRTHEEAGSINTNTLDGVTINPEDAATPGSTQDTTSYRAKLGAPVQGLSAASVYGEAEQAFNDADKKLLALGGEYRINDKSRLYGRHEFISSLSGPYAFDTNQRRDTTLFGIDNEYMKDGRAYSEYRARDAFSGREAEAAMGLKNQWAVADGVRINTSAERVRAIANSDDNNASNALTGGVEYTRNPNWKGSARLEWRNAPGSTGILNTMGLAWKLDQEWTFLGRNILNKIDNSGANSGDRLHDRLQLGFAYRDADTNVWNGLGRYEFKHEQDDTAVTGFWHQAHIVSMQANVQPQRSVVFSTRYAGKYAIDQSNGIDSSSVVHLVAGRVTYDIAPRWDIGAQVSTLFSAGSYQKGLGAEVGYQVKDNLWVSAGYNIFGFHDRDLSAEDNTERGAYFRIRFKFDENTLGLN